MRAPTEILGVRYFLLGVIFTRTDTRVESSHQGTPQNKNKSSPFYLQTARAFGPGQNQLFWGLPVPLGQTSTYAPYTTRRIRLLVPSRPGLITYHNQVQSHFIPFTPSSQVGRIPRAIQHEGMIQTGKTGLQTRCVDM